MGTKVCGVVLDASRAALDGLSVDLCNVAVAFYCLMFRTPSIIRLS